jgi:hypothetical protein
MTLFSGYIVPKSGIPVRWEWFYYGREKLPQNLFYIEYVASGDTADIQTNVDWFPIPTTVRRDGPAAELL